MTTSESERLRVIRRQAKQEIEEEDFRAAVDREKQRLRATKWWHRLLPFKIVLIRR